MNALKAIIWFTVLYWFVMKVAAKAIYLVFRYDKETADAYLNRISNQIDIAHAREERKRRFFEGVKNENDMEV